MYSNYLSCHGVNCSLIKGSILLKKTTNLKIIYAKSLASDEENNALLPNYATGHLAKKKYRSIGYNRVFYFVFY